MIYDIINDAAAAYKGIIPADRWHEPYMSEEELRRQIQEGVEFWKYTEDDGPRTTDDKPQTTNDKLETTNEEEILGVMGIQFKGEVTLIRHAYVRTNSRNKGIGGHLLRHLLAAASTPVLIGTWSDASWAIDFYKKHGFRLVTAEEKNKLLKKFWSIPERQVETSVVLASADWPEQ